VNPRFIWRSLLELNGIILERCTPVRSLGEASFQLTAVSRLDLTHAKWHGVQHAYASTGHSMYLSSQVKRVWCGISAETMRPFIVAKVCHIAWRPTDLWPGASAPGHSFLFSAMRRLVGRAVGVGGHGLWLAAVGTRGRGALPVDDVVDRAGVVVQRAAGQRVAKPSPQRDPSPGEVWKDRALCEHFIWVLAEAARSWSTPPQRAHVEYAAGARGA